MRPYPSQEPDSDLLVAFWRAASTIERLIAEALREAGVTDLGPAEQRLLWHIQEHERPLDQLRESLGLSRQAIWSTAQRLERKGYAMLQSERRGARASLRLAPQGREVVQVIGTAMQSLLDELVDAVPAEALQAFGEVLGVVAADPAVADLPQRWETYAQRPIRFGE